MKSFSLVAIGLLFMNSALGHPNSDTAESDKCSAQAQQTNVEKKDEEKKPTEQPPPIGNLSLSPSQQPSVLYGFGGNIIAEGEVQLFLFLDGYFGKKKVQTDIFPSILFGITDFFSVLFTFPYTPYNQEGCQTSRGIRDCFVQLEYAFYNKSDYYNIDMATLVGNVAVPTGSLKKNPHTGFGATSFFIGATYSRSTPDWFIFAAPGAQLTCTEQSSKHGDTFFYQLAYGQNIPSPPDRIYAWILEVDGQYSRKDRIRGKIDPNSGGNFIFLNPSIWVSTEEWIFQFGLSFPLNQNLFGKQRKFDYGFNANFSWSFY